jgi:DUF917 family protein
MTKIRLDEKIVDYAVYGGAILGGGGGGWIDEGLRIGRLALEIGQPTLYSIDEFIDEALLVTVSLVGAPAAKDKFVKPIYYTKALEILSQKLDQPIAGLITNENGAGTTINGWFQSAVTGIPVVDNPCNGRAHPTGAMGSLNLTELPNYISHQSAVGGKDDYYVELSVSGSLDKSATMIRNASIQAGGMVAVARNPVTAAYAKKHGATGGISQAIEVGEALLGHKGEAAIDAVVTKLEGEVFATGVVTQFDLETTGGFDVGSLLIDDKVELSFWNEYMTLEKDGERIATFPDLIMTLDANTAEPIVSAAITKGQKIAVITVPKDNLRLSSTMRNPKLMKSIEHIIKKPINPYS